MAFIFRILIDNIFDSMIPGARHLNFIDKIKQNVSQMNSSPILIPKFQGLECEGLKLGGFTLEDLKFESLVSDPSVSEASGPESFSGFDFSKL